MYQQHGNGMMKFHGSGQYGRGLGSFLAGMARAALPVLLRGGAKVVESLGEGRGIKKSLRTGISNIADEGLERAQTTLHNLQTPNVIGQRKKKKKKLLPVF